MLMQRPQDTDAAAVALFRHYAVKNEAASAKEGRPIFDDVEVVDIRFAGRRDYATFPATAFSNWQIDPVSGEQTKVTYAERFYRQYQQFKAHAAQTKSGTPLDYATFLTEARRAELRAQNVYTMEALAAVDGQELKNLGPHARDLKNKAAEYITDAKLGAPATEVLAEVEQLRARNTILEEDAKSYQEKLAAMKNGDSADAQFDDMSVEQLRAYIEANTGHAPQGLSNRKTLQRMAAESKPRELARTG